MRAVATARIRIQSTRHGLPRPAASCEPRGARGSRQADAELRSGRDRRPADPSPPPPRRSPSGRRRRLDPRGVEGDACHLRLACRKGYRLVQSHELRKRRDRVAGAAFDLRRACRVTEDEEMRCGAVDEPERHARVQRVHERAPALRRREAASAALSSTTSHSAAPARKSETTASTAIPQPAIAIPVCPVGTKTDACPRLRASRSSSTATRLLPDRAVRADGEDDARSALEVRSGRHAEPVGRLAQVAQLNAARSCELRQLVGPRR